MKKVSSRIATVLFVIVAALILVSQSVVVIPTGYSGVKTTFGQIHERTVPNGINFKIPFIQSVEKVNNKQQDIEFDDKVWSETKARTAVYFENVTVTYRINPEKSAWVYANVSSYRENLVTENLVASAIKSTSKELTDIDVTNRSIIEPRAMENIQKALDEKYGENVVMVNKVVINNADFDESYNEAIASKQKATLEAEQQAIENQKAIDKALADAEVKKTQAEAEAEAERIRAQGQADANRTLQESLSKEVLEYEKLQKWDGALPKFVGDGNTGIMIGLDDVEAEETPATAVVPSETNN